MIVRILASVFILVYGTLLPMYWSFKAIKEGSVTDMKRWLAYWMIFMLLTKALWILDKFKYLWIPFYYEIVIIIVLLLACPYFTTSSVIYDNYVHALLLEYEENIDDFLEAFWINTMLFIENYLDKAVRYAVNQGKEQLMCNLNHSFHRYFDWGQKLSEPIAEIALLSKEDETKLDFYDVLADYQNMCPCAKKRLLTETENKKRGNNKTKKK